jgi:hypothetical protein
MAIYDWYALPFQALQEFLGGFLPTLVNIVGAIIIFIIGWFVSVGIGRLVAEILKRLQFNRLFEKEGWKKALEKAELKVDASGFIGAIFKWVLVIVFLLAAVEVSGLSQFADFLKSDVLPYLPNVIVAALIFVVAIIIADILEKIVRAAVEGIKAGYAKTAGIIVKWAIWIFAILAILVQLKVAPSLIQTLFTGVVGLLVIAGGLAFGLGGKDIAEEFLRQLKDKLER